MKHITSEAHIGELEINQKKTNICREQCIKVSRVTDKGINAEEEPERKA